jgi:hypothetical protein
MGAGLICRVVGGALVFLIGAALAFGGVQLWQGGPEAWPDVVADATTMKRTSAGMIVIEALFFVAGAAAAGNIPWGGWAASIVTIVAVAAAVWVNYALFRDIRPLHTGTNVIVAAIILALLWFGYARQPS